MSATTYYLERPGYYMPWYVIITFDHSQQDYAWGVYHSDRTTRPAWTGHAPTQEAAEEAAQAAVDADQ